MSKLAGYESELKDCNIVSIQMNILNRCTSKCLSCRKYTWPKDMLSAKDIFNTLSVLKVYYGLRTVVFSGGDPILHPDIVRVVDFCKEIGIEYSIISTMITMNSELVEMIAKTAYRIHVSVDATEPELYSMIRGVNGFDKMEKNLELIRSVRPANMIPVRITSTIGKLNYSKVYDLYEFAKKRGCLINFYFLHTWGDLVMSEEEEKEFYALLEEVAKDEKKNKKRISNASALIIGKYSFDESYRKCDMCFLPIVNATINANGDIYPCCRLLNDNGEYGEQVKYAYGNVVGKSASGLIKEFEKRFDMLYPIDCKLCKECGQRYGGILEELETIMHNEKKPIFF